MAASAATTANKPPANKQATTKKKSKSGFAGLLASFCSSDKGHERETPARPASSTARQQDNTSAAAAAPAQKSSEQAKGKTVDTKPGSNEDKKAPVQDTTTRQGSMSSPQPVAGPSMGSEARAATVADSDKTKQDVSPTQVSSPPPNDPTSSNTSALAAPIPTDKTGSVHQNAHAIPPSTSTDIAQVGGFGRESPAQELGMTEVETGTQQVGEKVVVPQNGEGIQIPLEETEGLTSGAVQPPGSGRLSHHGPTLTGTTPSSSHLPSTLSTTGNDNAADVSLGEDSFLTDTGSEHTQTDHTANANRGQQDADEQMAYQNEDATMMDEEIDEVDRLIAQGGIGIPIGPDGQPAPLLPPIAPEHTGRKCLVLDLDETLLHSSFKGIAVADYIVPVEIDSQIHNVYVVKRPGVDNFLLKMGEIYEIVVFTASLSKYADPVLDILDIHKVVKHRLFRESCYNHKGNYVKDLSQLGRDISQSIIIDNSPASYVFHPNNAVPVSTWFNDPHDTELTDLCHFLADLGTVDDIRGVLDGSL